MTRPEEIDAALALCRPLIEEWDKGRGYLEHQRHCEAGDALCRHINTLARLLRAANPPAGAEGATEPATPAVGEDAGADCECTCASELAEKVRVLLADVARLQKELDGTTFREERYAEDAVGARLALEDARADVARLKQAFDDEEKAGDLHRSINRRSAEALGKSNEGGNSSWHDIPEQIAALRATLAAVRKIAEDYHDVDVTGDPPREVACNPCANDILNVLEGRKP